MNLFGHDILGLMTSHGYLLIFLIILLEEAGVPIPIPGDLLLLFTGSMIAQGVLGFTPVLLLVILGTLMGTSLLYTVAFRGGRPLLRRYGRWMRLKEERVDRAERWLNQRPFGGVALLRLTPGLRIYSTVVAGMLAVPRRQATISFVVSGALWAGAWLGLGFALGPNVNRAAMMISRVDGLFLPIAGVALAGLALFWIARRAVRTGALQTLRSRIVSAGILRAERRSRFGPATISAFALVLLLIMPPLTGTLHTVSEQVEAKAGIVVTIDQIRPMAPGIGIDR